jgi:haloalkane dehalogenase
MSEPRSTRSSPEPTPEALYSSAAVERVDVEDAAIALRVFGSGPPLVLIHGFPVHGYTWRKLLSVLGKRFSCHVVDLPGLGDSDWAADTDFRFTAQARRLRTLFAKLRLTPRALLAQNTGATIARLVAIDEPDQVQKLALINTEIPQHRPPWVRTYQAVSRLPRSWALFQRSMARPSFQRSSRGMGEFYADPGLFADPDYLSPYIEPLVSSRRRMQGALRYLQGIQWDVVDGLRQGHARIRADVLMLWGEDDRTFPIARAEEMCAQFGGKARLARLPKASLMPHEEKPEEVLAQLVPFLAARE